MFDWFRRLFSRSRRHGPSVRARVDSFETFRDYVLESVEHVGRSFTAADDDWVPMFFMRGSDAKIGIAPLAQYGIFGSDSEKDHLANVVLPELLRSTQALMYALVFSAWETTVGDGPSVRREIVSAAFGGKVRYEEYRAEILRRAPAPPKLGRWERSGPSRGRFFEPLRLALLEGEFASVR